MHPNFCLLHSMLARSTVLDGRTAPVIILPGRDRQCGSLPRLFDLDIDDEKPLGVRHDLCRWETVPEQRRRPEPREKATGVSTTPQHHATICSFILALSRARLLTPVLPLLTPASRGPRGWVPQLGSVLHSPTLRSRPRPVASVGWLSPSH